MNLSEQKMSKIGYASLTVGVKGLDYRSCTLKTLNENNIRSIIKHNLNILNQVIDYNIENNILMFRISSDLIPFASHEAFPIDYKEEARTSLALIGKKIKDNNIRVSMHPGQYTVLNSYREEVVKRAVLDLEYHCSILDMMELNSSHKIVLHIGGVYGDKNEAIKKFCTNYGNLSNNVKNRLIIENDDKSFNIKDVLGISNILEIPVVYDNLHNSINCFDDTKDDLYWIKQAKKTWKEADGEPKVHYSIQNPNKQIGSHSETIYVKEFLKYYNLIKETNVDIMLEVKDKNISAIKCINLVFNNKIGVLEREWEKYKYAVLEYNQVTYHKIRDLLKDKNSYLILDFYEKIENVFNEKIDIGTSVNATLHVFGYLKDQATLKEREEILKLVEKYQTNSIKVSRIKNKIFDLVFKYNVEYLKKSYFFYYNN